MWKKNEPTPTSHVPTVTHSTPTSPARKERAWIGPSIVIKGDLSGSEDLEIQGKLEGSVTLRDCDVSVAPSGRVDADIRARSIRVAGEVKGNLFGDEEVVIQKSGRVQGNITAARVTLENGSKFKGSIDMEPKVEGREPAGTSKSPRATVGDVAGAALKNVSASA